MRRRKGSEPFPDSSANRPSSTSSPLAWPMTAATERGGSRLVSSPSSDITISTIRRESVSS